MIYRFRWEDSHFKFVQSAVQKKWEMNGPFCVEGTGSYV